jgi:spore maturation protein CgeB
MNYNLLILTGDSNMSLSGTHAIHFPYTLLHALRKLEINANMTGLEDSAYLNSYGISYSLLQANLLKLSRFIFYMRKLRKLNYFLYKKGINKIIKKFKPDFVLAINIFPIKEVFKEIKKYSNLIFWSVDDPRFFSDDWFEGASEADFVLTQSFGSIKDYKERGITKVEFLPLAYDPKFFYPIGTKKDIDILFVGTSKGRSIGFKNIIIPAIKKFKKRVTLVGWNISGNELSEATICPPVPWFKLNELFNRARIVINIHVDVNRKRAGTFNYRDFETPGSGAFIISDYVEKMELCYKPNEEIIMVDSPEETIESLNYYLDNEDKRIKIANNAYLRASKEHTVYQRANFFKNILKSI